MVHSKRVYRVVDKATASELARILAEHTWCGCNGFRIGHLVFLNDSFSADGAQEYAVFDERRNCQIESLTVSWMTRESLEATITRLLDTGAEWCGSPLPSLDHPKGPCYACA